MLSWTSPRSQATMLTCLVICLVICADLKLIKELHCGELSCYEVLNASRDDPQDVIAKQYRNMVRKYHPDLTRDEKERQVRTVQFRLVAKAYETLKDESSRDDYNRYLDDPVAYLRTHSRYMYYRRRIYSQIDVRIVIVAGVLIYSAIQLFLQHSNHKYAIDAFLANPKYRSQALQIARENGLILDKRDKSYRDIDKEELKERFENVLRQVVEEKIGLQNVAKPSIKRTAVVQLPMLPLKMLWLAQYWLRWHALHTILRRPFSDEEKLVIIRGYLAMTEEKFKATYSQDFNVMLELDLCVKENFKEWKKEKDDEAERLMMQSGRYKSYQRWLKSGAASQITFEGE